jgi:molecular chaperone GrpE (heat shock protein)
MDIEELSKDFDIGLELTDELLKSFEQEGLNMMPAVHGSLIMVLHKVIRMSPDKESALAIISHCIAKAVSKSLRDDGFHIKH